MYGFRPLSGNLLSLPVNCTQSLKSLASFRPLSGNLLSLPGVNCRKENWCDRFSSPIGESTFSTKMFERMGRREILFSSPIGESTFSTRNRDENWWSGVLRFRPLSGNLLSLHLQRRRSVYCRWNVFVPYRGIYFLYNKQNKQYSYVFVFVPYRGIYFLYPLEILMKTWVHGFRPLSGNLLSLHRNSVFLNLP